MFDRNLSIFACAVRYVTHAHAFVKLGRRVWRVCSDMHIAGIDLYFQEHLAHVDLFDIELGVHAWTFQDL